MAILYSPSVPSPIQSAWLRKLSLRTVSLAVALLLAGCTTMQLSQFKRRGSAGDYRWIARQEVTCDKASDVCGQLHLIKGDACFRLAKADIKTKASSTCAADELYLGLALKQTWEDDGVQRQFQENLCESLWILRNLEPGETANLSLDRFVDAAENLYRLSPDSVPAVYYLSRARLWQMTPLPVHMNEANRIMVCNRLKRSVTQVLSIMETANSHAWPTWDRFNKKYQRLSYDLGSTLQKAGCR